METIENLGKNRAKLGLLGKKIYSLFIHQTILSLLAREYFGISAKIKYYDTETGEDTIHLVDEVPITFYGTYIVPKSSPFISKLNRVIHISREAGIIQHAIKSSIFQQSLLKIDRYRKGLIKSKKLQVIKIQHVTDLLMLWTVCIGFCFLAFLLELLVHKLKRFF